MRLGEEQQNVCVQGVLQGTSAELRETAAEGLGELVDVTSDEALRPFVVQITGPLIRIIGDRFPWEIKAAILTALGLLIRKSGTGLKPFVPQLQTTFLKCLPDQVNYRACADWEILQYPMADEACCQANLTLELYINIDCTPMMLC